MAFVKLVCVAAAIKTAASSSEGTHTVKPSRVYHNELTSVQRTLLSISASNNVTNDTILFTN